MSSEKTEKPTPKKIRDSRKKGQVAKSKEIVSLCLLLAIFTYFMMFGNALVDDLSLLFELPGYFMRLDFDDTITGALYQMLFSIIGILAPLLALVFVVGIISNLVQTGFIFSGEPVKPSLKKINPVQGAKKIFSIKNLMEFVKSIIKILLLGYTTYYIIRSDLNNLLYIPLCGVECALSLTGSMVMKMILYCLVVFIFLAAADFALEKQQHLKKLKMTKDEVKREYKQMEGNPEIKGKRKEIHREIMEEEIDLNVLQADVIVTNPTRIAVGIRYRSEEAALPWITVKGEFKLAQRIRKMAEKNGIPIVRRQYLARAMYAELEPGEFITSDFIEPVVEVLKWLHDFRRNQSEFGLT